MQLVILVVLTVFQFVWCQQRPEIINEINPKVVLQAHLNCTVVNIQPGQLVMWSRLTKGKIISLNETIIDDNKVCMDGSKKYEIIRREVDGRVTYRLVVHCLDNYDYGKYECYIRIQGEPFTNWPFKEGYLHKPNEDFKL